mgnify:CR=1 FL=1
MPRHREFFICSPAILPSLHRAAIAKCCATRYNILMKFADKMKHFDINIFAQLEQKQAELAAAGRDVINLYVGTPDLPPDPHVIAALQQASGDTENFKYSLKDIDPLIDAVTGWYARRYGVAISPDQLTSVYGSQEGLSHIALPLIDPGDTVIVPTPCYPVFRFGPLLACANVYDAPLLEENNYLIDLDAIPPDVAKRAKLIIVSYPNNPVTATAPRSFYEHLVRWAQRNNVIVVHDNAYSELVMDGQPGGSFLSVPGAMDVGIEFNSLSKSYNLTGLRISFAVGNADIINAFRRIRSQIDYGISYPVQHAAIAALTGPQDILNRNRAIYRERRDALCGSLRDAGWGVPDSPATMFVWAKLPQHRPDSAAFVMELMQKTGVICTPGSSFGNTGEGYVRFALVRDAATLRHAARLIGDSGLI